MHDEKQRMQTCQGPGLLEVAACRAVARFRGCVGQAGGCASVPLLMHACNGWSGQMQGCLVVGVRQKRAHPCAYSMLQPRRMT